MKTKVTKELLQSIVSQSESYADVIRALGKKLVGGQYVAIKRYIVLYEIDVSHFKGNNWAKGVVKKKRPVEDYFVLRRLGDPVLHNSALKKRLIIDGYKSGACEDCGLMMWNNNPIPTELHHANGNNLDNRIENLKILCRNCHGCTHNFGIKNKLIYPRKLRGKTIRNIVDYCENCGKPRYNKRYKTKKCKSCYNLYRKV